MIYWHLQLLNALIFYTTGHKSSNGKILIINHEKKIKYMSVIYVFIFLLSWTEAYKNFLQLHSPCNVCQRLAFHSKQSSCLIGRPGWFPANSQWRGSFLHTTEPPTAAPGSRFSPPWTPGHRDNLSEQASKHQRNKRGVTSGQTTVITF